MLLRSKRQRGRELVLLDLRVDLVGPGQDAAGDIADLQESVGLEQFSDLLAARSAAAVDEDFLLGV